MNAVEIHAGFVPLVDAAPLIVAADMGFAAEEGIDLRLSREASWSNIRDKVAVGVYPAAHMLAPRALAMSLGAGAMSAEVIAPFVLNTGGDVIGVSASLAAELWPDGAPFGDAMAVGRALLRAAETRSRMSIATPFPHSMHLELLRYWLEGCGGDPARDASIQTVPPPLMAEALAAGQLDVFCVGEPWGSLAVSRGAGVLVLPTAAIWGWAPEKVLGVRRDWAEARPETLAALLRALHRTGSWLARPQNAAVAAEVLGRPDRLDLPAELIERGLTGTLVVAPNGASRRIPRFIGFDAPEATFPWRSQAHWIASRAALRWGVEPADARAAAEACFRPDLYRAAVAQTGADLPGASSKVEGALKGRVGIASARGEMSLGPDVFFDGRVFDPAQ